MCAATPTCYWIFFSLINLHESHFISSWKLRALAWGREKRARQNSLSLITQQIRIKGLEIKIQFLPHQRSIRIRGSIEEPSPSAKHPLIEIWCKFYSEYNFTSGSVDGFTPGIHCKQFRVSQLALDGSLERDYRRWGLTQPPDKEGAQKASGLILAQHQELCTGPTCQNMTQSPLKLLVLLQTFPGTSQLLKKHSLDPQMGFICQLSITLRTNSYQ